MSSNSAGAREKLWYLVIAVVVLLLDQVSKYWVSTKLQDGNVSVISGFLDFSYTENRGIAFGMLNNGDMKWLLIVVSVAAIAVVLFYLLRTAASNRALLISLSLLAGGISGNLIDRIRLGRVIDFIDVYHNLHHWPVFNIADTAISIGALLLAIDLFLAPHTDQIPAEEQAQPVHADSSASQQET